MAGKLVSNKRALPKATSGTRTADYFKSVLSALYSWAIQYELLPAHAVNPAANVKKLQKKNKVEGHRPWTEEQIVAVLAHAPASVRTGVVVGLYTGQRLKDCIAMTTDNVILPVVRVRQSKTGNLIDVRATGPLLELVTQCVKDAHGASRHLILQGNDEPYSVRLFSEHLRRCLDKLGFDDISFHGLRYAAAGTLNEAGATVATITSIIGHSTYDMAMKYLGAREEQMRVAELMKEAAELRSRGDSP